MNNEKDLKSKRAFRIVLSVVLSIVALASLLAGIGLCALGGNKGREVDVQRDTLNYEKETTKNVSQEVIDQIIKSQN